MTPLRATCAGPAGRIPASGPRRLVTFRDYMESALYAAGGYYERRVPTADFYTAPELHPAFAGILAGEIARRLQGLRDEGLEGPYFIVEMGSGSGTLGSGILKALRERHSGWCPGLRYVFVERSETALLGSVLQCGADDRVLGYSRLEDVPPCVGVFLSNELVDAFPVHLLQRERGRMYEVYVETSGPDGRDARSELGEFSRLELAPIAGAVCSRLADGERHAVNLEAGVWLRQVAERLTAGALITVDYGKRFGSQSAPNPPRAFYRHAVGDDLTARSGRQDLTASVDFDELIGRGERLGLKLESYASLSRFLVDRGVLDWMSKSDDPNDVGAYRERAKLKTLLHPEGMGEAFKVLIQKKEGASIQ